MQRFYKCFRREHSKKPSHLIMTWNNNKILSMCHHSPWGAIALLCFLGVWRYMHDNNLLKPLKRVVSCGHLLVEMVHISISLYQSTHFLLPLSHMLCGVICIHGIFFLLPCGRLCSKFTTHYFNGFVFSTPFLDSMKAHHQFLVEHTRCYNNNNNNIYKSWKLARNIKSKFILTIYLYTFSDHRLQPVVIYPHLIAKDEQKKL